MKLLNLTVPIRDGIFLPRTSNRYRVLNINDFFYLADVSILSKLLTKLKPEFTEIQAENYECGFEDIITLDGAADVIINITNHEQVSFCQTSNMDKTHHQDYNYTGKVSKFNSIITSISEVRPFCSRKFAIELRPFHKYFATTKKIKKKLGDCTVNNSKIRNSN